MKINLNFTIDTEDPHYVEILETLKKLKIDNTIKEETIDISTLVSNAGRIESLFTEATNALTFWKLDDNKPDVNHWDVSGNTVVAIDKGEWMVLLQYTDSEGFYAIITDDRLHARPLFDLWAVGGTIRIAMDSLYKKFTKLKNAKQEVKS
jgi:hypothetical protein